MSGLERQVPTRIALIHSGEVRAGVALRSGFQNVVTWFDSDVMDDGSG